MRVCQNFITTYDVASESNSLAYPKLSADAREELACDHFTNALDDPDFALKVKERTSRTLDEALRIALRLEAWAKNVKQEKQEEDRTERSKTMGGPTKVKPTYIFVCKI